jgi:hypothetical protein
MGPFNSCLPITLVTLLHCQSGPVTLVTLVTLLHSQSGPVAGGCSGCSWAASLLVNVCQSPVSLLQSCMRPAA